MLFCSLFFPIQILIKKKKILLFCAHDEIKLQLNMTELAQDWSGDPLIGLAVRIWAYSGKSE